MKNFYAHPANLDTLRVLLGASSGTSWFGISAVLFGLIGMFTKENYTENPYGYVVLQFGKAAYVFIILASVSCYFPELFYHIPFVNMLRETYLYTGLLPIATTLLNAYGIYALYNMIIGKKGIQDLFYNVFLLIFLCTLMIIQYIAANYKNDSIWSGICIIAAAFFMVILRKNRQAVCMVFMLVGVVSFMHLKQYFNTYNKWTVTEAERQYEKVLEGYRRLQSYMDAAAGDIKTYRVMTWGGEKGVFSANSMIDTGGFYTEGYWEPIYKKTLERHWELDLTKRAALNNVLFLVIAENESEEYKEYITSTYLNQNFDLIGTVEDVYPNFNAQKGQSICVYKNRNYTGSAWFVYDYIKSGSEMPAEEQFAIINDDSFSVLDTALVEAADQDTEAYLNGIVCSDENANVQLVRYTNNSIILHCKTEQDGILVTTESDAEGWKVYVDGKEQEPLTVNYGNRGLLIDTGEHDVYMVYAPNGYRVGRIVTLLASGICAIAAAAFMWIRLRLVRR